MHVTKVMRYVVLAGVLAVYAGAARAAVDFEKQIAPILEEIAGEQAEQLTVAKLNVDDNPDLAMRYNVMSIPTLLVFSGGEVSKRLVGAKSKGALLQELDEFLTTAS